jgi:hypothetical protein
MAVIKHILLILLVSVSNSCFAQWYSKGTDAIIGYNGLDQKGKEKTVVLIVGFRPQVSCKADVSLMILAGKVLGTPVNQKNSKSQKSQLVVYVDGVPYTAPTKQTEYTNGVENAMFAPNGLLDALSTGRNISVRFGGSTGPDFLNLANVTGFEVAMKQAKANCKY